MSRPACADCLRRSWLVQALAGYIENKRHSVGDLLAILSFSDRQLLAHMTHPRRRPDIAAEYDRFDPRVPTEACRRADITPICLHDARYPAPLARAPGAPAVLYCAAGSERLQDLLVAPAAAIVGARKASPYALEVAHALGRGLSAATVTVVSGMAHGVDSAAHAGALAAGAATIAVLAGAPNVAYPAAKRALHRQLIREAAVISEWAPGFSPRPWCFTARNRIIAGLSAATIVVEAGERSGSLTTASFAVALNRTLGAVPGRVTAAGAAGSNALLFDGAHVVRDAQDALELTCRFGAQALRPASAVPPRSPRIGAHLRQLLAAVEDGFDSPAALFAARLPGTDVLAGLAELELLGLVRRGPGGRYVRSA